MLVIAFEPGTWVGGYGDRVVGLISVYLIAKVVKKEFRILWTKEDITASIDFGRFTATTTLVPKERINSIDSVDVLRERLRSWPDPFPADPTVLMVNQEIAHHIYANPKFANTLFDTDILEAYQKLYVELLRPTPVLRARVESFRTGARQIGIQLRCGDVYMKTTYRTSHCLIQDVSKEIPLLLMRIKAHIELVHGAYTVFVTSDWRGAIQAAKEVFGECVRGVDEDIQHLDRPQVSGLEKVFLDNMVLALCCSRLYISLASNYGRVAALASPAGTELFDSSCRPLRRLNLISKSELGI